MQPKGETPCDNCVLMAFSFYPDMCLHPAYSDSGKLGGQIEAAMLWGDPCPVRIKGKPIFWWFFDLEGYTSEEKDEFVELLRKIIAERMNRGKQLTGQTIQMLTRKLVLHSDISSRLYAKVSLPNHEEAAK